MTIMMKRFINIPRLFFFTSTRRTDGGEWSLSHMAWLNCCYFVALGGCNLRDQIVGMLDRSIAASTLRTLELGVMIVLICNDT